MFTAVLFTLVFALSIALGVVVYFWSNNAKKFDSSQSLEVMRQQIYLETERQTAKMESRSRAIKQEHVAKVKKLQQEATKAKQQFESMSSEIARIEERYGAITQINRDRERILRDAKHERESLVAQACNIRDNAKREKDRISSELEHSRKELSNARHDLRDVQSQLGEYCDAQALAEMGFYRRQFDFATPEMFKNKIQECAQEQKEMIKASTACVCGKKWVVGNSEREGEKMVKEHVKLMLRAFNNECDATIAKLKHSNFDASKRRIERCYEQTNKLGKAKFISINSVYLKLKIRELTLRHEYEIVKNEEKEEQREIRERIKEENKVKKEIEAVQKQAELEEKVKEDALTEARKQLAEEHGRHNEELHKLIVKLETELQEAVDRKAKAISRAQLVKSGHVYILSNIGSLGEGVYKIGLTRRLDPQERVKELGSASVPFPFDVHAMIYSEDAPALEKALHDRFDDYRVNLVNKRKEWFRVSLDEIGDAVANMHGNLVSIVETPDAEEYRTTMAMLDHDELKMVG